MDISLEIETLKKTLTELEEQKEDIRAFWKGKESELLLEKYDMVCESLKEDILSLSEFDD